MLTVGNDEAEVERQLAGGQLECPGCGGQLRGWGHARDREIRLGGEARWSVPAFLDTGLGCQLTELPIS